MNKRATHPAGLRAAFSLIELLVVLLIFAILVGISVTLAHASMWAITGNRGSPFSHEGLFLLPPTNY